MKKLYLIIALIALSVSVVWAGGDRETVPKVRYLEPRSEAVIDLTGKDSIMFKWNAATPSGGRVGYRFTIYKGFGYERAYHEEPEIKANSIEVPADIFEDGQLYTWQVKQRAGNNKVWSMDQRWSFTVKKPH